MGGVSFCEMGPREGESVGGQDDWDGRKQGVLEETTGGAAVDRGVGYKCWVLRRGP